MNNSNPFPLVTSFQFGVGAFLHLDDLKVLQGVSRNIRSAASSFSPKERADTLSVQLYLKRPSDPKHPISLVEKLVKDIAKQEGNEDDTKALCRKVRRATISILGDSRALFLREERPKSWDDLTLSEMNAFAKRFPEKRAQILIEFFEKLREMDRELPIFQEPDEVERAKKIRRWMENNSEKLGSITIPEDWDLTTMAFPPEAFLLRCFSEDLTPKQFRQLLIISGEEKGSVFGVGVQEFLFRKGVQEFLLVALHSKYFEEFTDEDFEYLLLITSACELSQCLTVLIGDRRFSNVSRGGLEVCLQWASAYGNVDVVKTILQTRGSEIDIEGFTEAFENANRSGQVECLKELISCDQFHEISTENFGLSLQNSSPECLKELIACDRFQEIDSGYLGGAGNHFVMWNQLECLKELIGCNRFSEISTESLDVIFYSKICDAHIGCLKALISCDRFQEISTKQLGQAFVSTAHGHIGCLKEIMACSRFHEISAENLGHALWQAAGSNSLLCLKELMGSERFQEISTEKLRFAFYDAAGRGHLECLKELIGCNRFREISTDSFTIDLGRAAENGEHECLKEFINCDRFKEIDIEVLKIIVNTTAGRGHIECIREFIACDRCHEIGTERLGNALVLATQVKTKHPFLF